MLNESVYQLIYDEISDFLPASWEKIVVYLEHGEDSYSYSFYVKNNNEYKKCFDLENISEEKLLSSFARIEKVIAKERKKEKNVWSNMTMIIDKKGALKVDFDYTDLSDGTYQYKKEWKKKYLNE